MTPRERNTLKKRRHNRNSRQKVLAFLGGKCVGLDGKPCSFNCSDWRALQIDHINGGGNKERNITGHNSVIDYHKVMKNPEKFQLLCANCNQIKKYENHEGWIG
jgi:hypothetical protein